MDFGKIENIAKHHKPRPSKIKTNTADRKYKKKLFYCTNARLKMELLPTDTVNLGGFWHITAVNKNTTGETLHSKHWTTYNRNKEHGLRITV